jgi:squalene synthase HpnC
VKSTTSVTATKAAPSQAAPVTHYENFPVASILCPPTLRPPIAALYHFARTADDLADEGDATAAQRLADLAAYRQALHAAAAGDAPDPRWAHIFGPLQHAIQQHQLPVGLMDDLLSAFAQDVDFNARTASYADREQLLDYCRRSANPVGRLLLHLYGVQDATSLQRSDAICSALQLINFWQDLSVDLPRGRHYLTDADCARFGVQRSDLLQPQTTAASRALVMDCAAWARQLMQQGAPLVHHLPGRAGWELRLVVQGGLRILEKVEALQGESLLQRPTVGKADLPRMLWKALRMSPP